MVTAVEILETSRSILKESKSRASKNPRTYKCIDKQGHFKGRANVFRLTIPEILEIHSRLESGEDLREITKEYPISYTSILETLRKYYSGLFDFAILEYENWDEDHPEE